MNVDCVTLSAALIAPLICCVLTVLTSITASGADNGSSLRVQFPDPNIFQSPYTWRNDHGSAIAPTGGAYLKGVVKGTTSIHANVDTSINAGNTADDMPTLK